MNNQFEKIVKLINEHDDRAVVLDANGEPAYVLISFAAYERLLGENQPAVQDLSPINEIEAVRPGAPEPVEAINEEIAAWQTEGSPSAGDLGNWHSLGEVMTKDTTGVSEGVNDKNSLNEEKNKQSDNRYEFEPM